MSILWRSLLIDVAVKTASMLLTYLQKRYEVVSLLPTPTGKVTVALHQKRQPVKTGKRTKV